MTRRIPRGRLPCLLVLLATLLLAACASSQAATPAAAPRPPAAPVTTSAAFKASAEARYLPAMTPALSSLVRQQPWFAEMTQPQLDLIVMLQKSERIAAAKGQAAGILDMLQFAAEQPWYQDGIDDRETLVLNGAFEAYTRSLEDDDAPPIGSVLASTLRNRLFDVVKLPESGDLVLLVSAAQPDLGRKALELAVDAMPKVERVTGKYPYRFLHIEVVAGDDLPNGVLGLSYNEFIEVSDKAVNADVLIHEITHATLYGIFPTWFEEGFAHLLEYQLTATLDAGAREYTNDLRRAGRDTKLDLRPNRPGGLLAQLVERAQGFLFLKSLSDIRGIEGVSKLVRSLRTRSYTDQELMRAIVADGTPEEQAKAAQLVCQQVIGTTRNYCAP